MAKTFRIFVLGILLLPTTALCQSVSTGQENSLDQDIKLEKDAKQAAAEIGKDYCVGRLRDKQDIRNILQQRRLSVGDMCSCVERELTIILPYRVVQDFLITSYKMTEDISYKDTESAKTAIDEFEKFYRVAGEDCINKLFRR